MMKKSNLIRRVAFVMACFMLGMIVFSTVSPLDLRPRLGTFVIVERFGAFAALGFLLAIVYPRRWLAILIAVLCLAVGLEYGQTLVSDRHARWSDLGIKMAGGAFGTLLVRFLLSRREYLERFFCG